MKRLLVVWLTLLFAFGCVQKGSVKEREPLTADLARYKTASVEVDMPTDAKNAETTKTHFQSDLGKKLKDAKIFSDVAPGGGDMIVRVKVTKVDRGNEGMQATGFMANAGAAEVKATVELVDVKQDKVVGSFYVSGNSKSNVRTTADDLDDAALTALGAAGDQIVDYLDKHRSAK